jgi:DNA-binding response OmpR family regulator
MENKNVLIVEDNQMVVQLVSVLLENEGYVLRSAFDATEALNVLSSFKPHLILMDIQLPGKSGLDLIRQLRANRALTETSIVALTGYARQDDEQNFLTAGCDGYITKPINTSTFAATVRSFIEKNTRAVPKAQGDVRDLLRDLRNHFITEALAELGELSEMSDDLLRTEKGRLLRAFHRWGGIAGTLGMPKVTGKSKETEYSVEIAPNVSASEVRAALSQIKKLIAEEAASEVELVLPSEMAKTLSGKRFGLGGFSEAEAKRITETLHRGHCFALSFEPPAQGLSREVVDRFDIVILNLNEPRGSECLKHTSGLVKPLLLVGSRTSISEDTISADTPNRDLLMTPWDPEELLVRCCRLFTGEAKNAPAPKREGPAQVLIADDDPTIGALLVAVLRRPGAECRLARNGSEALTMMREVVPDVLILDVNMPGIDGFEVLTNLRADGATARVPVVLLTARQQESDVLKGFSCGASDYITKPFNPMEVTARVARYLPARRAQG